MGMRTVVMAAMSLARTPGLGGGVPWFAFGQQGDHELAKGQPGSEGVGPGPPPDIGRHAADMDAPCGPVVLMAWLDEVVVGR